MILRCHFGAQTNSELNLADFIDHWLHENEKGLMSAPALLTLRAA
jgi:hypothetical protein